MSVYVIKDSEGKYLAPTAFSKFQNITLGDCVPEQAYAARYYERNQAVCVAVRLNWVNSWDPRWRVVKLVPRTTNAPQREE